MFKNFIFKKFDLELILAITGYPLAIFSALMIFQKDISKFELLIWILTWYFISHQSLKLFLSYKIRRKKHDSH